MPTSLSILTDCIEIFNIFLDVFTHYLLISQVKVIYRTKGHLMNYWCKGLEQKQVNDYQCKVESQLYLLSIPIRFEETSFAAQEPYSFLCAYFVQLSNGSKLSNLDLCLLNFFYCVILLSWDDKILSIFILHILCFTISFHINLDNIIFMALAIS